MLEAFEHEMNAILKEPCWLKGLSPCQHLRVESWSGDHCLSLLIRSYSTIHSLAQSIRPFSQYAYSTSSTSNLSAGSFLKLYFFSLILMPMPRSIRIRHSKLTGSTNSFCSKLPPPRDQSLDDYSFSESAVHHYASLTAGCCIPSLTGLILTSTHPLTHSITRNGSLQHNRHPNSHHPNHLQNHNPLLRLPLLRQIILSRNHPDHRGTELSKRCSGIHAKSCRKNS